MSTALRLAAPARAAALGLAILSLAACVDSGYSRTAANGGSAGSSVDVVGGGGPQDDLARQIYHPGSGTDW